MAKIVEAVGTATGAQYSAREIEAAMAAAVEKCYATGVTDPEAIRAAQLQARKDYKTSKQQ